jgi:oligosaccharide repeat unit polymerase
LTDVSPIALLRDYESVPNLTNVYTVYEVYFRDFWYFGVLVPPVFLVVHWELYRRANFIGGIWIFFYSASIYPLVMQFFQDQYFSMLSMWMQIGFWYWFLLVPNQSLHKVKFNDA